MCSDMVFMTGQLIGVRHTTNLRLEIITTIIMFEEKKSE